jgi:hypothetical protein
MSARLLFLRNRLRSLFCASVAAVALAAAAVCMLAPAALTPLLGTPWTPLHARCVGAMALSLAVALLLARRGFDPAATRMPLLALAAWCGSAAAVAWTSSGSAAVVWPWGVALLGGAALVFAHIDGDPPAPAQHADIAWRVFALLALMLVTVLLLWPRVGVMPWPWRLPAPFMAQYAPLFLAWGLAAWLVSRERRRYVRVPVLWGLLVWAVGVLLASAWHAAAFARSNPLAWLWFAGFAALAALAAHRLWPALPAWPQRLRRALGLVSRDSGTRPPRQ